jgi:hypothetical protein
VRIRKYRRTLSSGGPSKIGSSATNSDSKILCCEMSGVHFYWKILSSWKEGEEERWRRNKFKGRRREEE